MSILGDKAMIRALEGQMSRLGDTYYRKEAMAERHPNQADRLLAEMDQIEAEQDEINAKLGSILKRYSVVYNGGSYTCTNARGAFTIKCEETNA